MFFRKIELKKLINSEPGAKFSIFPKTFSSSLGSAVTWGVVFTIFYATKTFITSSDECISHPKVSKRERGMGNHQRKSNRFNATLEVNVTRVKNEFIPKV
jgi:hypothetical protein